MTGMEPIWIGAAAKGLTDIVVKPVSEVLNRRLDEPFQQFLYDVFGKYIQNYNERHGLLKVLGMPEPVQLEDIYTAVQFIFSSLLEIGCGLRVISRPVPFSAAGICCRHQTTPEPRNWPKPLCY